jgi:hypothetical protein
LIDLKSFVEQILKLQGKWSSPGGDVKLFCGEESKFSIKWYGQRSRKLIIQADSDEHYLKLEFQKLAGTCEDNNADADDLRYVHGNVCNCTCSCARGIREFKVGNDNPRISVAQCNL